ncbi:MAG TPA: D-alanine--D-alanine ligase family protein [Candidatus Sumerlaeota bacterium]|nr:D-alanine--D-alanine ligase family protein [Candidatus Sumerlaeota bacterium]
MQSKRLRAAVICGGISPEHEVSLSSGRTSALALDRDHYDILPICIRKTGDWLIPVCYLGPDRTDEEINKCFDEFQASRETAPEGVHLYPVEAALIALKVLSPDIALLLLHGRGGEDGLIQGFLEFSGIRYTGPGVLASALAMDKIRCLRLLANWNYQVPPISYRLEIPERPDFSGFIRNVEKKTGYPCFIKPARVGSSVGMSIAHDHSELEAALLLARKYDSQIMVEEFIRGVEVTCGVLDRVAGDGTEERIVLPPTEIVLKKAAFFDYESKYTPGMTEEITPARLPEDMIKKVQDTAGAIYQLIGCSGMSRIDMIIRNEEIFVLECNTIPGMTPTSLLPQGAAAAGIGFPELLDIIVNHSIRKQH